MENSLLNAISSSTYEKKELQKFRDTFWCMECDSISIIGNWKLLDINCSYFLHCIHWWDNLTNVSSSLYFFFDVLSTAKYECMSQNSQFFSNIFVCQGKKFIRIVAFTSSSSEKLTIRPSKYLVHLFHLRTLPSMFWYKKRILKPCGHGRGNGGC